MFGISFTEFFVMGIVALLVFGSKVPEVARNVGLFLRKIQKLFHEIKYDIEDEIQGISPKSPGKSIEERKNG